MALYSEVGGLWLSDTQEQIVSPKKSKLSSKIDVTKVYKCCFHCLALTNNPRVSEDLGGGGVYCSMSAIFAFSHNHTERKYVLELTFIMLFNKNTMLAKF